MLKHFAAIIVLALNKIAPVYKGDDSVTAEPSVVYLITAVGDAALIYNKVASE